MSRASHQTVRLAPCRHDSPDDGVCVMELASMLAGEPFTDRPESVSPSLAALLRGLNDGLDDEQRQTLKPFAATSVGTVAHRRVERERRRRIGRSIGAAAHRRGPLAWLGRAMTGADPYSTARETAQRIAAGDEGLRDRVFALVDELVLLGRTAERSPAGPVELLELSRPGARADPGC